MNDDQEELPSNFDPTKPLSPALGPFQTQYKRLFGGLLEMVLIRIIDNFTTYLSELIRDCLRARPEALRSRETITYEIALRCESVDELREVLIDRKVDELAYLGFEKLSEWIGDRLGVKEINDIAPRATLLEILETRNCLVHNRGKVNGRYLRSTQRSELKIGQVINVNFDTIFLATRATAEYVEALDSVLAKKFGLATESINAIVEQLAPKTGQ